MVPRASGTMRRKGEVARMIRPLTPVLAALATAAPASAAVQPFPKDFRTQMIDTNGTKIHVRVGGTGPAVVMLHGFGDSGDMWAPIAAKLVKDLSRSLLERALGQPESDRRGDAPALRQALRAAARHARRIRAVRCLRARRKRQQGLRRRSQADHADPGGRRGEVLRHGAS